MGGVFSVKFREMRCLRRKVVRDEWVVASGRCFRRMGRVGRCRYLRRKSRHFGGGSKVEERSTEITEEWHRGAESVAPQVRRNELLQFLRGTHNSIHICGRRRAASLGRGRPQRFWAHCGCACFSGVKRNSLPSEALFNHVLIFSGEVQYGGKAGLRQGELASCKDSLLSNFPLFEAMH